MLLFIAAAAFALLLAPTRGEAAPATKSLAGIPAVSPRTASEIADPWSRAERTAEQPSALARQAADFAAVEVVDPWADRPLPPPAPVTVLDLPVDPWARDVAPAPVAAKPTATAGPAAADDRMLDPWQRPRDDKRAPAPAPAAARDEGVRDPWRERRDPSSAPAARKAAPAARDVSKAPPAARGSGVHDPWSGRTARPKPPAARPMRPRVLPPPQSAGRKNDGVRNPWE